MDNDTTQGNSLFLFGELVATAAAVAIILEEDIQLALNRHANADWGDLDPDDWEANEKALIDGGRLFSSFLSTSDVEFWVITEADRSSTAVLLPSDY